LFRFIAKKAYQSADAITCVSDQLQQTLKKYISGNNIHIIPNVIDTNEFYYDATIIKPAKLTFIAAAHWDQHKNPFYFLDALELLKTNNEVPDFKMLMAGEGKQLDKIKSKNYSFDIDYKGNLSGALLNETFNKSSIFLHGSDFETFSVVIAEALSCGLPSVVSPVGIAPEVIKVTNGFVTDNTVEDWKNKILACVNTQYNYQQISDAVKNRYSAISVSKMFDEVYKLN
jgi:glycosyltransferase involved in cell wall biosynthesis